MLPVELIGPAADRATITDPGLRSAISMLHQTLVAADELLDGDARLALIC